MHKYPQENQNITNVQTKLQRESLLCHFASTITKPTNEREREREREREILQLQILGFMSVRMRGEEMEMWTNEWENDLGILQILDSFRKG